MSPKKRPGSLFTLLEAKQYKIMKWKNGLGETKEIAVDDNEIFLWRFSRAALFQSGPFSLFPNYDRKILFLGADSVKMRIGGKEPVTVEPLTPFSFSGDLAVYAEIKTPGHDL